MCSSMIELGEIWSCLLIGVDGLPRTVMLSKICLDTVAELLGMGKLGERDLFFNDFFSDLGVM